MHVWGIAIVFRKLAVILLNVSDSVTLLSRASKNATLIVDCDNKCVSAPLNDKVLLNLAKKMGTEYVIFGVSLGLTAMKVQHLEYDYKKAVTINFQILRTWRDNVEGEPQDNMFDTLANTFLDTEQRNLHDIVRNGE